MIQRRDPRGLRRYIEENLAGLANRGGQQTAQGRHNAQQQQRGGVERALGSIPILADPLDMEGYAADSAQRQPTAQQRTNARQRQVGDVQRSLGGIPTLADPVDMQGYVEDDAARRRSRIRLDDPNLSVARDYDAVRLFADPYWQKQLGGGESIWSMGSDDLEIILDLIKHTKERSRLN